MLRVYRSLLSDNARVPQFLPKSWKGVTNQQHAMENVPMSENFLPISSAVPMQSFHPKGAFGAFRPRTAANTCVNIVPEGEVWIVERLGKYLRTLSSGLWMLIPLVDKIQYIHSIKEQGIPIPHQSAITRDNVMIEIDGILFMVIVDGKKASYNIDNPIANLVNLAQTSMRSEIGKLTLDDLFEERDTLNKKIVGILQKEASEWGVECKRYEIRDITVSDIVRKSMDLQAEAERRKRKIILESEGEREASINKAKGFRIAMEQEAQAKRFANEAVSRGELAATLNKLEGLKTTMQEVRKILLSDKKSEGLKDNTEATKDAMQFMLATEYLQQFGKVAKENNSVVLAAPLADPQSMLTQALTLTKGLKK